MEQRLLGRTGMSVSVLGYGAFKIGRNRQHRFAADYNLPTAAEAMRLLNTVLDAGITLIDSAPAYGLSEERIGRAIGHRREEFVLTTKVGESFTVAGASFDFTAAAVRASIEQSLARLRTDHLDVVFVHSDGNDLSVLQQTDVVPTLQDVQRRGLVRAIGFSGKTAEGGRAALEWADALMVTYHQRDVRHLPVIRAATAAGVGVIVKKGLDSGRLPAPTAIPFVLGQTGVSSLLFGTRSQDHVLQNVAIAEAAHQRHDRDSCQSRNPAETSDH